MVISLLQVILLGLIQGAAELLPVSSSAHVIVAEKLMGIDPTSPEATFLLIMLHTGTMFAVLAYFWKRWYQRYFSSVETLRRTAVLAVVATALTGVIGEGLKLVIERGVLGTSTSPGEVEELFGKLWLIGAGLAAAGILILAAGYSRRTAEAGAGAEVTGRSAAWMGLVQGLVLPFRGFSRSGSTISVGLFAGTGKRAAEDFSFVLAVILTPPLIVLELHRLMKLHASETEQHHLAHLAAPALLGMVASFLAGLLGLRLLSRWLEQGRWQYFGYYCLFASLLVFALWQAGV
jgi:undecaprenyl-diphosphatase